MKPLSILIFSLCSSLIAFCQSPIQTNCQDPRAPEYLWNFAQTKEYITNYRENYKRKWRTHTRTFFINSESIYFLKRFFEARCNYEGVTLHFCVYRSKLAGEQSYKKQFGFYFTAGPKAKARSEYTTLKDFYRSIGGETAFSREKINHISLCPGSCDSLTSNWGPSIDNTSRLAAIAPGGDGLFFFDENSLKRFKKKYRRQTQFLSVFHNRRHTRSVYITWDKVYRMTCFLDSAGTAAFPAVGFYLANYSKKTEYPDLRHRKQITVDMEPMRRIGAFLEPDPCSYFNHVISHSCRTAITRCDKSMLGDNHSELCPDTCPEEDDH